MLTESGGLGGWGGQCGVRAVIWVRSGVEVRVGTRGMTEAGIGGRGVTGTATRDEGTARKARIGGVSAWAGVVAAAIRTAMERIAPRIRAASA
jgi:hypothetical protein